MRSLRREQEFKGERIFIDVDSILPGKDFATELDDKVVQCDIFLIVIGRNWVAVTDEAGKPRLNDPSDWVRVEIESALRRKKTIIPILVNNAQLPRAEMLPARLRPLLRRQSMTLTHERFGADVQRLVGAIRRLRQEASGKE